MTLGVRWNAATDEFIFQFHVKATIDTKREVLRTISSIFDPLGFLISVTFAARSIMQRTWLLKVVWDDKLLDPAFLSEGKNWMDSLALAQPFKIK